MKVENQILYHLIVEVDLTPQHPLFFKVGGTVLMVWILDSNASQASQRIGILLSPLPYKITGKLLLAECDERLASVPVYSGCIETAKIIGVAFQLIAAELGEEIDLEKLMPGS